MADGGEGRRDRESTGCRVLVGEQRAKRKESKAGVYLVRKRRGRGLDEGRGSLLTQHPNAPPGLISPLSPSAAPPSSPPPSGHPRPFLVPPRAREDGRGAC